MTSGPLPRPAAGDFAQAGRRSAISAVAGVLLAAALLAGGLSKVLAPAPLAAHVLDVLSISPSQVPRVEAAVRAAGFFEIATGLLALAGPWTGTWTLWLVTCVAAFSAWDLVRFAGGDDPDCGCFGAYLRLPTWGAVAMKDVSLWLLLAAHVRRSFTPWVRRSTG